MENNKLETNKLIYYAQVYKFNKKLSSIDKPEYLINKH